MLKKSWMIHVLMCLMMISTTVYVISNSLANQWLSNILSPIATLISGLLISMTMKNSRVIGKSWLFLAIMAFFWGISDLVWMVLYNFYGINPEESVALLYLYSLPNLFLVLAGGFYFKRNLKKWHRFQLVVDGLITFVILVIILLFSIFEELLHSSLGIHEYITTVTYLVLDLMAFGILVVLLLSARVSKLSRTMIITVLGYVVYIIADLAYVYQALMEQYIPNSLIDTAYVLSIVIFGVAAYAEYLKPTLLLNPDSILNPENQGGNKRLLLLLVFPSILIYFGLLKWVAIIFIVFFLGAYYYISIQTQKTITTESQLLTERVMNEKLEEWNVNTLLDNFLKV